MSVIGPVASPKIIWTNGRDMRVVMATTGYLACEWLRFSEDALGERKEFWSQCGATRDEVLSAAVRDLVATRDAEKPDNGATRIAAERDRQVLSLHWDAAHDDDHARGELAQAAACYALVGLRSCRTIEKLWPWDGVDWKAEGRTRIRQLEKAGALIAAEIDRLLRMGDAEKGPGR